MAPLVPPSQAFLILIISLTAVRSLPLHTRVTGLDVCPHITHDQSQFSEMLEASLGKSKVIVRLYRETVSLWGKYQPGMPVNNLLVYDQLVL